MSEAGSGSITGLVSARALDADLAAVVWLLSENGVPLTVAAADRDAAQRVRRAFESAVSVSGKQAADQLVAGGIVIGRSLEDVLAILGGQAGEDIPDGARDLGVVAVADSDRVRSIHYVRPVERDAAGHLQRRPPALLGAWDVQAQRFDHFHWGVTDELATRAGMSRDDFEDAQVLRAKILASVAEAGITDDSVLLRQLVVAQAARNVTS
jgi:hypothetical protein